MPSVTAIGGHVGRRSTPNASTPWIAEGVLHIPTLLSNAAETTLLVDSDAWRAWLSTATKLYVYNAAGNFSVRKTARQRGGLYWTARRRQGGRLIQAHIGPADALTGALLATVPARLAAQLKDMEAASSSMNDAPNLH